LLFLSLLLAVYLLEIVGQRLQLACPIVLCPGPLAHWFGSGHSGRTFDPELIFLPPLLYRAAWGISLKDFWKWRRVILPAALGLVILTAGEAALVSQALVPGFTLALGFLLGGIVSHPMP
jgi:CPA1 family monovalent cation:H+ antiporter